MRALWLLALLLPGPAAAGACDAAALAAEERLTLPPGLLSAIGRVESGRRDGAGRVEGWPWSVNAAGRGYFLQSAAEAVALVANLRAQGVQSIDVGCFQVNLMFHPDAFATLADGFDPAANAMAAARFLRELHAGGGLWEDAVGRYHSANPGLGVPYMRQVMASWTGGPVMAGPPVSQVAALVRVIVPHAFGGPVAMPSGLHLPTVFTPGRSSL